MNYSVILAFRWYSRKNCRMISFLTITQKLVKILRSYGKRLHYKKFEITFLLARISRGVENETTNKVSNTKETTKEDTVSNQIFAGGHQPEAQWLKILEFSKQ